ncbi:MAG: UDP-N-acetylmuramate dehydrogenase [Bacteroidales bacterium]|nr:UDP-N-acetylmuramate dehydrogenase [Bacteroidales bacterium]
MKKEHSLQGLNTMGFNVIAKYFCEINTLDDIKKLIDDKTFKESKKLFLGGGSNILFADEYFDGIVIHSNLKGISFVECEQSTDNGQPEFLTARCMSGETWKDFVDFTVSNNLYGLENLVDIPGSVGAAPVQNIGAYGSEVKDCITRVYAINIENGEERIFENEECNFAYRNSIFKKEENKKYFIYAIDFKLKKDAELKLEYGNIKEYLVKKNIESPTLSDVANAIKTIRAEKLPEVGVVGSVGSFFQNPIIDADKYQSIKEKYPEVPSYPNDNGVKIPAGWLIDKAGWKGYRENHVGVWDKQALVLVHYGGGKPEEILNLMNKIQGSVKDKFGIEIKPEVNIVGNVAKSGW